MRGNHRVWPVAAALLLIAFSFNKVSAEVRYAEIDTKISAKLFLDYFGFKPTEGRLELNVSNISFISNHSSHHLNLSQVGFFLTPRNFYTDVLDHTFSLCALHSEYSNLIYTFDDLNNKTSFDLLLTDTAGQVYDLWFESCLPVEDFNISMNVRSAMYNLEPVSGFRSYMSATKLALPTIYTFFMYAYLCLASLWVYVCWRNMEFACRIHVSILVVMLLKCLSIFLELKFESYILQTGCSQCWYSIVLLITSGLLDATPLIVLMLLILGGWSYMKPHLSTMDKFWIWLVISLGIGFNCFNTVYDSRGYASHSCYACGGMASLYLFTHFFSFLFLELWTSTKFLNQVRKTQGKASMVYEKITQMRASFYAFSILVVVIFFVVATLDSFCPTPQYLWLSIALKEASVFAFYVYIGYKLRPKMPNILINEDMEKAVAEAFNSPYIQLYM